MFKVGLLAVLIAFASCPVNAQNPNSLAPSQSINGSTSSSRLSPEAVELIRFYVARRQRLVQQESSRLPQLSQAISQAMNDAIGLSNQGLQSQALARVQQLSSLMPISEIPSYDLHNFLSYLYGQLQLPSESAKHRHHAAALREILTYWIGKGTFEDPLKLIMVSEIRDYARIFAGQATGAKTEPRNGRELMVVSLQGMGPKEVVVEIDPRVRQASNARLDRYQVIPVTELRPEDSAFIDRARQLREEFFADNSFNYLALVSAIREQFNASEELARQGRDTDALTQLLQLQKIRPIEQIPSPRILSLYSFLLGRTGNPTKQREIRGLIFGIQQVIAQSGDGSSPERAFEVMMIDEEYDVLDAKKLKRSNQRLLDIGADKFDVITTENAQGEKKDMFFKITRMYGKYRF